MGMRARLERDLVKNKYLATVAFTPKLRNHLLRRVHLLELVLSGRYAELELLDAQRRYLGDALERHLGGGT